MLPTVDELSENTVQRLQDLIAVNLDSSRGLETAAEKIENPRIAAVFRTLAPERRQFAAELQKYVRSNHTKPSDSGSIKGTLHRWWLNLHGTVRAGEEHAVLSDAEAGEDAIKHKYEEVLKDTASSPIQSVLNEQYQRVKAGHDTIRDLRDMTA
ncbi:MAG: PA2169 family four-helix-bundle protein [Phycisphaerales bacterium]|nr:PA2169 family four-helix-bundle protein [Phycisphaerales bacterium]